MFRGEECFNNHKIEGTLSSNKGICGSIKKCTKKTYKIDKKRLVHKCDEILCKNCDKYVSSDHLCYIKPNVKCPPSMKDTLFVFYDLETRQEKTVSKNKIHEPNLCVYKQCCDKCLDLDNNNCDKCGKRLNVLLGNRCVDEYVSNIITISKKFKKVVVLAHNGKAFDHQFILKYILENTNFTPKLIMRGSQIILMEIENIKFIDSLNYFPMALSALPKAFDLKTTLTKGYFPHLFNTLDNADYIGLYPNIEYYSPDSMKADERDKFLVWFEQCKLNVFDMRKEIIKYCINDVEILSEACLKFRKLLLDSCNVCPFTEATTIASTCNLVYRRNYLKDNQIAIIPKNGYRWVDNQSISAIEWILWEQKLRNIFIKSAATGKEHKVCGLKVDGFCEETKEIFEFHGCFYHGCTKCFLHGRDKALYNDNTSSMNLRYASTLEKTARLRNFGYVVKEMWECDFKNLLTTDEKMELKTNPLLNKTPLNPRDSFYGGRTGNTTMYYKAKDGEQIKYFDVCSLYPYICKYGKFPLGHPTIIIGHEECLKEDLSKINGLIKCSILPPSDLFHPVLPLKQNNKLMFSLCYTCSKVMNQGDCMHTDTERTITNTWVIDEVIKALEMGYRILEIHEIWSYKVEQYSRESNGLFSEMMNKFIKMKQEASGWPSSCNTTEEKNNYIDYFLQNEGVQLDFNCISKNSGLRSVAKLMLNSFWGKFGQKENQSKTQVVKDPIEMYSLLTNPSIEVHNILPVNEETNFVTWQYLDEVNLKYKYLQCQYCVLYYSIGSSEII